MRIDGSMGEGGGQILRTSVALSAILGEEIEVFNIRAGRKNPGLRNQHLWGIKLVAMMSNARVEGLRVGSTRIKFSPGRIKGGEFRVDVGTAGSITLLLQAALPVAIHAPESVRLKLRGGTDVPWSPPADYYSHILLPILRRMGANIDINIIERGYYPEGGGELDVIVEPSELKGISILNRGELIGKEAYINMRKLPGHIVERMENLLVDFRIHRDVKDRAKSRGCGILLSDIFSNTILSGDQICRKGLPAEKVAKLAIEKLRREENSKATVDVHMGDHLITFGFLARGSTEFYVREITGHIETNALVVEKFGGKVEIGGNRIKIQA